MDKLLAAAFIMLMALPIILIFCLLFALVTKVAWAYSVAQIFNLPELTLVQAFALNVLGAAVCKGSNGTQIKTK